MPLKAVIGEHHGTSLVRYFYARATEGINDPAEQERLKRKFRYPGPRPSSRESGIIALADTIEAAARSIGDLDEVAIRNLVFKLIADRIEDGELNDCPLTLSELAFVRESFVNTLVSRHHKRPVYPPKTPGRKESPPKPARGRRARVKAKAR
jgi:membrane-associated HD superfamily phosphohydrolase